MEGRLILVSGPPASGKSALARRLARAWPGDRALHLHSDDAWTWFAKGYVPPWTPASTEQNLAVMEALAAAAVRLAAYAPVVFDGVIGPWFVAPYEAAARAVGTRLDLIFLRPPREVLLARAAAQPGHPRPIEPLGRLWDQFADPGRYGDHVFATGELDAEAVAQAALAGLATERWRLA